jgi:hypothetical protein
MDVIRFVLYVATKVTGWAFRLVAFLLEKLTGHVLKRAHQPAPQQEPQPARHSQPVPAAATAVPAVHVHVHLDQAPAQPAPPPSPEPAGHYGNQSSATVLNRTDHRIYVTTGSHLMLEHPACDDLLERLDEILYRAAFRDGDPFTVAPPLDDARHGRAVLLDLPPVAAVDEGEFFSEEREKLPPPDGALWLRQDGVLRPL